MSHRIEVISTAHWEGDPRLNRHLEYLRQEGHSASLVSFAGEKRGRSLIRALGAIRRSDADVVLVPDPELFVLGSLTGRISGKRVIIDIHEDFPKAARARTWIPGPLRSIVGGLARVNDRMGRSVAWRTLVAAPELKREGDWIATNVPDPSSMTPQAFTGDNRLVYVGDVTEARGALTMVEVLAALDDGFELFVIGRVTPGVLEQVRSAALGVGVASRLHVEGRKPHSDAWDMASGALVGLNLLADVPAYREAVATKLWEYMAIGLPPIVSDLPGQRRVVASVDESLVCDGPEAVARAVSDLRDDPERRERLGNEFRSLVERTWADARPDLAIQSIVEP